LREIIECVAVDAIAAMASIAAMDAVAAIVFSINSQ